MRLPTTVLLLVFVLQLSPAFSDRKTEFQSAYQAYQQQIAAGNKQQALGHADDAYRLGSRLYGKKNLNTANLAINYATLLNDSGEYNKARKTLKGKSSVLEDKYGNDSPRLIPLLMELGRAHFRPDKPEEGLAHFDRVLALTTSHDESLKSASTAWAITSELLKRNGNRHTRPYVEVAYRGFTDSLTPVDIRIMLTSYHMAIWAMTDGQFSSASSYLEQAAIAYAEAKGTVTPLERTIRMLLIESYERSDRSEDATPHCVELARDQTWELPVQPLYRAAPEFSPVLSNFSGDVTLEFTINEQGRVVDPVVKTSDVPPLDQPAIAALRQFRYAPRMENGAPVPTEGVTFTFTLEEQQTAEEKARFERPPLRRSAVDGNSQRIVDETEPDMGPSSGGK